MIDTVSWYLLYRNSLRLSCNGGLLMQSLCGEIKSVLMVVADQRMYKLTVDKAHTFIVVSVGAVCGVR